MQIKAKFNDSIDTYYEYRQLGIVRLYLMENTLYSQVATTVDICNKAVYLLSKEPFIPGSGRRLITRCTYARY
jgi:hypothetical protein